MVSEVAWSTVAAVTNKSKKAALGKSRRLMSSCIKQQLSFQLNTIRDFHIHFDPDRNTSPEIYLNAGEKAQSLLPEADRMPLSRSSPYADAGKRAYRDQLSASTDEELRLLGGPGYESLRVFQGFSQLLIESLRKHDPEAVSIAKPGNSRHSVMFGKVGLNRIQ